MVSKVQRVKNSDLLTKLNKIATSKKMLNVGFLQKEISKIAIINEYGAKVPVTDKARSLYQYNVDKVLHVFGEIVEGAIREMIEDGEFQANHPLTIAIKGGAGKPLVHTGKMSKSVSYEVI